MAFRSTRRSGFQRRGKYPGNQLGVLVYRAPSTQSGRRRPPHAVLDRSPPAGSPGKSLTHRRSSCLLPPFPSDGQKPCVFCLGNLCGPIFCFPRTCSYSEFSPQECSTSFNTVEFSRRPVYFFPSPIIRYFHLMKNYPALLMAFLSPFIAFLRKGLVW